MSTHDILKAFSKGTQAAAYGVGALTCGAATLAGGGIVLVSIPALLACCSGVITGTPAAGIAYAGAFGTMFCAHKAAHKINRAIGNDDHEDKSKDMELCHPGTWCGVSGVT